MKGMPLTEHYVAPQGEGPRTGRLTQFVRFGGCNMRCPGWPCDTPDSIFPDRWRYVVRYTPQELADKILDMYQETGVNSVCLTGGEPTMQPLGMLDQLVTMLGEEIPVIEMFTNGSHIVFPRWMCENVRIVLDWKLPGSGEGDKNFSIRRTNMLALTDRDALKFTIASDEDYEEAIKVWVSSCVVGLACGAIDVWIGAVWGQYETSKLIERVIEDKLPWNINVQTHKFIHPGIEKGI